MIKSSLEIRKKFINYFISKGHTYVSSSPVLPPNEDKTLLFTNAGMVQFKDVFLGIKDSKYKSAVTSQNVLGLAVSIMISIMLVSQIDIILLKCLAILALVTILR